jgi:hypothetical protein
MPIPILINSTKVHSWLWPPFLSPKPAWRVCKHIRREYPEKYFDTIVMTNQVSRKCHFAREIGTKPKIWEARSQERCHAHQPSQRGKPNRMASPPLPMYPSPLPPLPMTDIECPTNHDVKSGRGVSTNAHVSEKGAVASPCFVGILLTSALFSSPLLPLARK